MEHIPLVKRYSYVENLILNLTSLISGVFINHEEDLPLRKQEK
jgi:hypothetical protein